MYIHKQHRWDDRDAAMTLIEAHPFGAWICHADAGHGDPSQDDALLANHLPFLLDRSRGRWGTLLGHVARANPVWRSLPPSAGGQGTGGRPSLVMFQGPQGYISPGWYPGKAAHGRVVPTWNYAVVHVRGRARAVQDRDWLIGMLQGLTAQHERGRPLPWSMDDAPADYIDAMLRAIVGIEIPIERLEAKRKASQDEAMEDRRGTVAGLMASDDASALALAQMVQAAIGDEGSGAQELGSD